MKKQKIKKNSGVTLVELTILMALIGLLSWGAVKFFQDTFDVWWTTRDSVNVHSSSRGAIDELSKYIRQASTQPITITGNNSIRFKIAKSTTEWHSDLTIRYFKDGSLLRRLMKGTTTTLIPSGVELFHVWYNSGTASRYAYVGTSITVTQGKESARLNKKIMLRGRR